MTKMLVDKAKEQGGDDNITVVLARVEDVAVDDPAGPEE